MSHYGLIEAGGTKVLLGICDAHGTISARHRIDTTSPDVVLGEAIGWFQAHLPHPIAIGIASFGPLDLSRGSPTWGHVTRTTKAGWSGADVAGPFARALGCPVGIETDVNGAALAEARWGAGVGHGSLLYLTIGTGVGGGFVSRPTALSARPLTSIPIWK